MSASDKPKPYNQWRAGSFNRAEDAAHTFGYHLIEHCRREALKTVELAKFPTSPEELRTHVAAAGTQLFTTSWIC